MGCQMGQKATHNLAIIFFNYNVMLFIYKYKNNCLKLKNEVGMEVLKSKQTRVVYRDNQHIRIVHPYACFLIGLSDCVILLYTSIHQYS